MEIKIDTKQILNVLYILSFIIFIGICIEAGSFIFNGFFTLVINPQNAKYLGLVNLYQFNSGYYVQELLLMIITTVMKAIMFYLIVKMLHDKKLNILQPFNTEMGRFIFNLSYLTLGIGLFSYWGVQFSQWLIDQGIKMPSIENLRFGGADVWIFMGITLFIIAQLFKRGIEIQAENDLTI
ncbi:DUF2975 domain-containing protein [Flavobacterium sp. MC2016-06]|uniref:DUF2975 domain-containing protein n=1 Tax=Flavobacterium sp. MC2016-06 TaxID=2676308 RepID=UPI0012BAD34A|nr:DUF2975 domain-containing protein [Flavobacterium sp. MC2016-06]MBU3858323.1 DUF2975 domain-containing protein [Flavobacterium sp. MC2016-06]